MFHAISLPLLRNPTALPPYSLTNRALCQPQRWLAVDWYSRTRAPCPTHYLYALLHCMVWYGQVLQAARAPEPRAVEEGGTVQQAEEHGDVGPCGPEGLEHQAANQRPQRGLNCSAVFCVLLSCVCKSSENVLLCLFLCLVSTEHAANRKTSNRDLLSCPLLGASVCAPSEVPQRNSSQSETSREVF